MVGVSELKAAADDVEVKVVRIHSLQKDHLPSKREDREALIKFGINLLAHNPDFEQLPAPYKSTFKLSMAKNVWNYLSEISEAVGSLETVHLVRAGIHFGLADRYSPYFSADYRDAIQAHGQD